VLALRRRERAGARFSEAATLERLDAKPWLERLDELERAVAV
jgi:hypothetical protein